MRKAFTFLAAAESDTLSRLDAKAYHFKTVGVFRPSLIFLYNLVQFAGFDLVYC